MEIGVLEAKDRLGELLDRAEQGESIVITRQGKAVATLAGISAHPTPDELQQ